MSCPRSIVVLLACAACARSASGGDDPAQQPPEPLRLENTAMVAFHMRAHFRDLRDIERMLLAGKLVEAKTRAFLLTIPAPDPGLAPWSREIADVSESARSLADAPSVDEALRREVRVAAACAWCHARAQKLPVFVAAAAAPADDGTVHARMVRHQWAADRLWEGMIGASDRHWRAGLDVLATTPAPFPPLSEASALAAQLQHHAQREIEQQTAETFDERARGYGEMLVTCAACHLERR